MTNLFFLALPNGHYVLASGFALSWLYSGNASKIDYFEPWNLIIIHSFAAAQIYDDVYTFKVAAIRALPSRSSTSSTVKTMSRRPPSGWGRGSPCTMWPPSPWKHQSMAGLVAHGSGPTKHGRFHLSSDVDLEFLRWMPLWSATTPRRPSKCTCTTT